MSSSSRCFSRCAAKGSPKLRSRLGPEGELRYGLTERGRAEALDALTRSGYAGPAPVALDEYCDLVAQQSTSRRRVERDTLERALEGMVVEPGLIEQVGPAMNSGRAMLLYGIPGTGKTYLSRSSSPGCCPTWC